MSDGTAKWVYRKVGKGSVYDVELTDGTSRIIGKVYKSHLSASIAAWSARAGAWHPQRMKWECFATRDAAAEVLHEDWRSHRQDREEEPMNEPTTAPAFYAGTEYDGGPDLHAFRSQSSGTVAVCGASAATLVTDKLFNDAAFAHRSVCGQCRTVVDKETGVTPEYRVIRAFGAMPYGGLCHFRFTEGNGRRTVTMDDVAHNLERLIVTLNGEMEQAALRDGRLARYEEAFEGLAKFREVLGTVIG